MGYSFFTGASGKYAGIKLLTSSAPPNFYDDTDDVPKETLPIDMGLSYLTIGGILLVGFLMHKKVIVKNQKN